MDHARRWNGWTRRLVALALAAGLLGALPPAGAGAAESPESGLVPPAGVKPLADVLAPDGSLSLPPGFQGALDPTGWHMGYAANGAPIFQPAGEIAEPQAPLNYWWPLDEGLSNAVYAIVVEGPDVYVGGSFSNAGDVDNADSVARWNGTAWHAMGPGLSGTVYALAVEGTDVYAGGIFWDAGGNPSADHLAHWDGSAWHSVGAWQSGFVAAVALSGGDLFVGGTFTDAKADPDLDYIARWDGTQWNALENGLNGPVYSLLAAGRHLYVGGDFANAGSSSNADRIAVFDGTSFGAVGGGLGFATNDPDEVYAIAGAGANIYVGGSFENGAGDANMDNVAHFDGEYWHALGGGLNGSVYSIAVMGPDVYVGGAFTDAGGNPDADYMARWDGASWHDLGAGPPSHDVRVLAPVGNRLYVGGSFANVAGFSGTGHIASWITSTSDPTWNHLGPGLNGSVLDIEVAGADVYVGGSFTDAGGVANADRIARWDGWSWHALETGIQNGIVHDIEVAGPYLYVVGTFTDAGGDPDADYIARWTGHAWTDLGSGLTATGIYAIAVEGKNVYVGGQFENLAAWPEADNIAAWNSIYHIWYPLGNGLNGPVYAIDVSGTDVYAGGAFTDAGGAGGDYVAHWDGSSWNAMGTIYAGGPGTWASVRTLAAVGGYVYAGGRWVVPTPGGATWGGILKKWDGFGWSLLSSAGLNQFEEVSTIVPVGRYVYFGGDFADLGGQTSADRIARWNADTGWSHVGYGLGEEEGESVSAIAVQGLEVYAGGSFENADDNEKAENITRWGTPIAFTYLPLVRR